MSQKLRGSASPTRALPEHLITGEPSAGEERLIGGDTGLAAVMTRADIVARSAAPVLLFGETGTGKEIVARAIHERVLRSRRRKKRNGGGRTSLHTGRKAG